MSKLSPHRVAAYNISRNAENKIHDDEVARRFGLQGALVPGAEVYGYMTNLAVQRWGRDWLEHGAAECRFHQPVYDGEFATVTGEERGDALSIRVESRGVFCAEATATLDTVPLDPPAGFEKVPPAASRSPADEVSLAAGTWLATAPLAITPEYWVEYLRDVRETAPIYGQERLVHPGLMLRLCNSVLVGNVVLGPWIHVGSSVRHLALAGVGDELTAHAQVLSNYERKGHRFVDLDVLIVANETTPVARVKHVAIYRPRQVVEAS
jgi:acyl dehydratase